jgi:hypothetical protein
LLALNEDTMEFVTLGFPGPVMHTEAMVRFFDNATREFYLRRIYSPSSWCNFNALLADAHNAYKFGDPDNECEPGQARYFAMMHADVIPEKWWIDTLIREMKAKNTSFCSALIAIKDCRGEPSGGIGEPGRQFEPRWRFTFKELADMPDTFTAEEIGHGDGYLLHNNGLIVADLSDERFLITDDDGYLVPFFDFPRKVFSKDGRWIVTGESEDWYFSRMLHKVGIPSCVTKKVPILHEGRMLFPNWGKWGEAHDPDYYGQRAEKA